MNRRRLLLLAAGLPASLLVRPAFARAVRAYDASAFAAAQANDQPILIEISAPWCSVCRAQKPIIQSIASNPSYAGLTVFEVDFDSQKDIVRSFRANAQSTLIMFRGRQEVGRSVGDTNAQRIEALVKRGFGS